MKIDTDNRYVLKAFDINEMKNKLEKVSSSNKDSYLLSAIYYYLTGRKGAWLCCREENFLVVINHPHIKKALLIFPEVKDDADFSLTSDVISSLANGENVVYLSRYTDLDFSKLKVKLSSDVIFEKITENSLDWKYPLHILDTEIVSELKGGKFEKIRNKCLRVGKEIEIIPIEGKKQIELMKIILKSWEEKMKLRVCETEDMFGFYNEVFKLMDDEYYLEGLCFIRQGNPMGFTLWDICANNIANLFVNLSNPIITGSSDFQLVTTCRYLKKKGVHLINLGGSELETLDFFKRKYMPVISHNVFTYRME